MSTTAAFLIVGNEILSGRTQDANLNVLAKKLSGWGVLLKECRVIADEPPAIQAAVKQLSEAYTYVFTSGGIGPTHDDITADNIAEAFGVPLLLDPKAVELLENHYKGSDLELNDARLRMARIPEGGIHIDNPVSSAPGFQIQNVFVMAGVPRIFAAMLDGLQSRIKGGPAVASKTIITHKGEGDIAAGLVQIDADFPDVDAGSYPFMRMGRFGVSIVLKSQDYAQLEAAAEAARALVRSLGDEPEEPWDTPNDGQAES